MSRRSGLLWAILLASCGQTPPATESRRLDSAAVAAIATLVNTANFSARDSSSRFVTGKLEEAYRLNPGDDAGALLLAVTAARSADTARLAGWLDTLAARRSCLVPGPWALGELGRVPAIATRLRRIEAARRDHPSEVAFEIATPDLMPESIGYDPSTGSFYIGSLVRRQIFRLRRTGVRAALEPFTEPGQDGLFAVIGIKVDAERRLLWAASGAERLMGAPRPEETGRSVVVAYDLETRKLRYRFSFAPPPARLTNDLALDAKGRVFVTDTDAGALYRIDPDQSRIDTLAPPGSLVSPNGVAVTRDGATAFVGAWSDGIWRIDVATGTKYRLPQVAGPRPVYIDGLYLRGTDLIGITWALSRGRVSRFTLAEGLDRITAIEELECNHPAFDSPTTGVVVGDSLFYIANSQFTRYAGPGRPLPIDSLRPIVVLKRKL